MRTEFSKRTKQIAWTRSQGNCEGCGAKLFPGKYAYDHIRPDALLGEAEADNCQCLCSACHGEKTRADVARISKAKRQEAAHIGAKQSANPMPCGRNSRFKKLMSGKVVDRVTGEEIGGRR